MVKHLLLDNIHIYEKKSDKFEGTEGSFYSSKRGFWLEKVSTNPLVQDPRRPLPSSKKHDVERGEDKK
ncbi:hypothetical protein SAMN04487943_102458 [Gracilibacillus orientalis]|uniref:Uncharacterized protein n=1 Tax=Gracilibacillus orientalis TaxID=334253 RepID=A0A1I4J5C8_9BACI|nr:hypothetical protein [Gracilibacillus orientalis]SFL61393.1 hypothetical protein SAMN04487943_102458 [Gracilibacillus orientalis]